MTKTVPNRFRQFCSGHTLGMSAFIGMALLLIVFAGWTPSAEAQNDSSTMDDVCKKAKQTQDQTFEPIIIERTFGAESIDSIKQFQESQGLEVTGELDAATLTALRCLATSESDSATDSAQPEDTPAKAAIDDVIEQLKEELYSEISVLEEATEEQIERIARLTQSLGSTEEQTQQHSLNLDKHEKHLKDNSVKLYETLVSLDAIQQELEAMANRVHTDNSQNNEEQEESNRILTSSDSHPLLLSTLCLLIPLGIFLHQSGFAGPSSRAGVPRSTAWMVASWVGAGFGFYLVGFGIMFGASQFGWAGMPLQFFGDLLQTHPVDAEPEILNRLTIHVMLVGIVSVIACSAVSDRMTTLGHLFTGFFTGAVVYPLFGHWSNTEPLLDGNPGWLSALGYTPSGGATGVALLAGVAGISLAIGMRGRGAAAQPDEYLSPYTTSGTLLLWVAWSGVILGTSTADTVVASLLFAMFTGTIGAGVAVVLIDRFLSSESYWRLRLASVALTGLVASSGVYSIATGKELILIGIVAGGLHTLAAHRIRRYLGSGIELCSSFAVGGLVGTLGAVLLSPDVDQILPQLLGFASALVLAIVAGRLIALPARNWAISRPSQEAV